MILTWELNHCSKLFESYSLLGTHAYTSEASASLASMKHQYQSQTRRLKHEKTRLVERTHHGWIAEFLSPQVHKFFAILDPGWIEISLSPKFMGTLLGYRFNTKKATWVWTCCEKWPALSMLSRPCLCPRLSSQWSTRRHSQILLLFGHLFFSLLCAICAVAIFAVRLHRSHRTVGQKRGRSGTAHSCALALAFALLLALGSWPKKSEV